MVLTGGNEDGNSAYYEVVNTLLRKYILPAVVSNEPLPANDAAADKLRLAAAEAEAGEELPYGSRSFKGKIQEQYLHKTYRFDGNNLIGLKELALSQENPDELRLALVLDNFTTEGLYRMELTLPLDGSQMMGTGRKGLPLTGRITYAGDDRLEVYLDEIGNIDRWGIRLKFREAGKAGNVMVAFEDMADRGRSMQAAGTAME
ncbi:hypothetical protein D3C75_846190 [compost metagenome]